MSEEAQIDGLSETETQFFESGGEIAPEAIEEELQQEESQEEEAEEQVEETAEQEETTEAEKPQESPQEKTVPLAALHEERMRRREMKQQMEAMENRLQQVLDKLDTKTEPPAPDFEDEPLEAIRHELKQTQQQIQAQNDTLTQQQQAQQMQEYQTKLIGAYQNDAARFAETHPDFGEAYQHMYESRRVELEAYGYTPDQVEQTLQAEEFGLAQQAFQNEMSPAEVIYNAARARGYTPKPAGTQEAQAKTEDETKFEMAEKGQQASRSLSSGGKSEKEISLEALADMNDDEFDKMWDKLIG